LNTDTPVLDTGASIPITRPHIDCKARFSRAYFFTRSYYVEEGDDASRKSFKRRILMDFLATYIPRSMNWIHK